MPSFKSAATFVALAGLAAAAPPYHRRRRGASFTVEQVKAGTRAINVAQEKAHALRKFNINVPDKLAAAAASSGSAAASPDTSGDLYLTPITVGGSQLQLDLDTGSSDLWVFGSQTPRSESSGKTLYAPGSASSEVTGETWTIQYGDGSSAGGVVYSDTASFGGISVTSQAVEVATTVASQFESSPGDGLFGLAFSSLNTITRDGEPAGAKTFFDNVVGSLAQPVFTTLLKQGAPGTYAFGELNPAYTPSYTAVDNSQGFWQFQVTSNSATKSGFTAIADTGTTLLLVDQDVADGYWNAVSGAEYNEDQGAYTYPCGAALPDFSLTIGNATIRVTGKTIEFSNAGGTCTGGISTNEGEDFSILGDVFLQNAYVVFENSATPRIGFAQQ